MLGLVPDPLSNDDGKFRKWVFNPHDKNFMNLYLQAKLWLGKLCEINVADIHIDLVPDVAHTPRV